MVVWSGVGVGCVEISGGVSFSVEVVLSSLVGSGSLPSLSERPRRKLAMRVRVSFIACSMEPLRAFMRPFSRMSSETSVMVVFAALRLRSMVEVTSSIGVGGVGGDEGGDGTGACVLDAGRGGIFGVGLVPVSCVPVASWA